MLHNHTSNLKLKLYSYIIHMTLKYYLFHLLLNEIQPQQIHISICNNA